MDTPLVPTSAGAVMVALASVAILVGAGLALIRPAAEFLTFLGF